MHTLRLAALASVLSCFGAFGCSAGTTGEDFDLAGMKSVDGGRCTPGDTQQCICLGGGMGTQTCRASGASFGPCSGCSGGDLPDGIMTVFDMGGSPCGDCDGCCQGATCVPFNMQTNTQCGGRGQTCAGCTGGKVCAAGTGQCVDNSGGCGACTNGCCGASTGNVCLLNQPAACGTSCTKCAYGVTCSNGACTNQIDTNAYFKVVVKSAKVIEGSMGCTGSWDYIGEPDPYVCVGYQSGGTLYQGCNIDHYVDGTLTPMWDNTTGLMTAGGTPFLVPASVFMSGKMQISLWDDDNCFNGCVDDLIAQGFYPGKTTLETSYSTGLFGCAMDVTFQLQ